MTADEVLAALREAASGERRALLVEHGVTGEVLGVGNDVLGDLATGAGFDAPLAEALWAAGVHEARVLATLILDPDELAADRLVELAGQCDNFIQADALSALAARMPDPITVSDRLRDAGDDHSEQIGWNLVAVIAQSRAPRLRGQPDAWFEPLLDEIERTIQGRGERARHSMNVALCAIGVARVELREQALHVAAAVGEVRVERGATPDAVATIQRAVVRDEHQRSLRRRAERRRRKLGH